MCPAPEEDILGGRQANPALINNKSMRTTLFHGDSSS